MMENSDPGENSTNDDNGSNGFRRFGPGFLVAAAFIGPGTVTTAISAGGRYGFHLLWGVGFAVFATVVFQEMALRLGLATRQGLASAISNYFKQPGIRYGVIGLLLAAIVFGNAAYQAGNLSGAATGMSQLFPGNLFFLWLVVCSGMAWGIIWFGDFGKLKIVLTGLVILMSLTFVISAIQSRPAMPDLFAGLFSFEIPWSNLGVLMAIIGTTVVPYNLFLHSSAIAEQNKELKVDLGELAAKAEDSKNGRSGDSSARGKHSKSSDPQPETNETPKNGNDEFYRALSESRLDSFLAIFIGGIVTASIVITAAKGSAVDLTEAGTVFGDSIGNLGRWLFFLGLFAAGLTSAITAPLAAGLVYAGCLEKKTGIDSRDVKLVATVVIGIGLVTAAIFGGKSPTQVVLIAQIANGLILPVVAVFLLFVMNSRKLLGDYRNSLTQNIIGGSVVLFIAFIGLYKLGTVFGVIR